MLATFGPPELRDWCAGLGEPTFVGSSGRVFPRAFRATPLLRAWLARLVAMSQPGQRRRNSLRRVLFQELEKGEKGTFAHDAK